MVARRPVELERWGQVAVDGLLRRVPLLLERRGRRRSPLLGDEERLRSRSTRRRRRTCSSTSTTTGTGSSSTAWHDEDRKCVSLAVSPGQMVARGSKKWLCACGRHVEPSKPLDFCLEAIQGFPCSRSTLRPSPDCWRAPHQSTAADVVHFDNR